MRFSLSTLSQFIDLDGYGIKDIECVLNDLGFEVESIGNQADKFEKIKIVKVVGIDPHPNADQLQICRIFDGLEERSIVCGAKNVRVEMHAVFADVGAIIPGGNFVISERKIRGVISRGMLCSASELCLPEIEGSDGIIEVENTSVIGSAIADYFNLNDYVIEISVTPNRGDCMSIYGIARDISARIGTLKPLPSCQDINSNKIKEFVSRNDSMSISRQIYFAYMSIDNTHARPKWLIDALAIAKVKSISLIVDLINYTAYMFGQPMHVYDAEKVSGELSVFLNKKGASFRALNGIAYDLNDSDIVIKDSDGALHCIAGVIGGADSACTSETRNIIIEAGHFSHTNVALTSRRLHIYTESSARFERQIDLKMTEYALLYVINMIQELSGGSLAQIRYSKSDLETRTLSFAHRDIAKIGLDLSMQDLCKILKNLGFEIFDLETSYDVSLTIGIPSWRNDVMCVEDICEEVARIYGYRNIRTKCLEYPATNISDSVEKIMRSRSVMTALGFDEVITYSFGNPETYKLFLPKVEVVILINILNPINPFLSAMRPSIVPNLIDIVKRNEKHNLPYISIFECGPVFLDKEVNSIAALRVMNAPRKYYQKHCSNDFYDIKGDLEDFLSEFGIKNFSIQNIITPSYYHYTNSGTISYKSSIIGYFGMISPVILSAFDISYDIACFELFTDVLNTIQNEERVVALHSPYQISRRDMSFLIPPGHYANSVIETVLSLKNPNISNVFIFDEYIDQKSVEGHRYVGYTVEISSMDKTMTDEEIDSVVSSIIASVEAQSGYKLRG